MITWNIYVWRHCFLKLSCIVQEFWFFDGFHSLSSLYLLLILHLKIKPNPTVLFSSAFLWHGDRNTARTLLSVVLRILWQWELPSSSLPSLVSHLPPFQAPCNYHVPGLLFFSPSALTRRWILSLQSACHCSWSTCPTGTSILIVKNRHGVRIFDELKLLLCHDVKAL